MTNPKKNPDWGRRCFWLTVALQLYSIAGKGLNLPGHDSKPLAVVLLGLPILILIVGKTWKTAIKYSLLASLTFPVGMGALALAVLFMNQLLGKTSGNVLTQFFQILAASGIMWYMVFLVIGPIFLAGLALRGILEFARRKKLRRSEEESKEQR